VPEAGMNKRSRAGVPFRGLCDLGTPSVRLILVRLPRPRRAEVRFTEYCSG